MATLRPPCCVLLTSVPKTVQDVGRLARHSAAPGVTGDTSVLLFDDSSCSVIDSHRHDGRTLHAAFAGEGFTAKVPRWIHEDGGLLDRMQCWKTHVEMVVVRPKSLTVDEAVSIDIT